MKVHWSFIVNLKKISNIQDYTLLIGGPIIPIGKLLKTEVMGRINIAGLRYKQSRKYLNARVQGIFYAREKK